MEVKAVCSSCLCHLRYTTHFMRCLLASLAGIMHARMHPLRPGTDELLCFCMSRLRRGELSEVFGLCAYVCVRCASCVRLCRICCVTYRYFHQVRVGLLLLVGRGRFGNENEMKRNEALACVRESACDDNSCRMTSVLLRQTNLAIESFVMCAAKYLGQVLPAR